MHRKHVSQAGRSEYVPQLPQETPPPRLRRIDNSEPRILQPENVLMHAGRRIGLVTVAMLSTIAAVLTGMPEKDE